MWELKAPEVYTRIIIIINSGVKNTAKDPLTGGSVPSGVEADSLQKQDMVSMMRPRVAG